MLSSPLAMAAYDNRLMCPADTSQHTHPYASYLPFVFSCASDASKIKPSLAHQFNHFYESSGRHSLKDNSAKYTLTNCVVYSDYG